MTVAAFLLDIVIRICFTNFTMRHAVTGSTRQGAAFYYVFYFGR